MGEMEHINLIETFSEFKEFKNIDRETLMRILEDVFRHMLIKKHGTDENIDIIVNVDKGDLEIWRKRTIVEDDVIIYSNATILGRIVIGHDSVIGGNVWVTNDLPAFSRVVQTKTRNADFSNGGGI